MIILFWISLLFKGSLAGIMIFSILIPERRIWPLKRKYSGHYFLIWVLTTASLAAVIAISLIDWNSLGWPFWVRYAMGGPLFVAGNTIALWAVARLGIKETSGVKGNLSTGGLYRYSRNPQYVGDIVMMIGWAIMSASGLAIVCIALGIFVFILMPFAEEPWLKQTYGERYHEYAKQTPRFLLI